MLAGGGFEPFDTGAGGAEPAGGAESADGDADGDTDEADELEIEIEVEPLSERPAPRRPRRAARRQPVPA